jgi:hypothetical protein
MRTLYRRVAQVAIWRRPKLTARGDPDHDHVVAGIVARLLELPRRAVVLAEDETHLNLLPHVRASWTPRGTRPKIPTPGKNRQVTVLGALELTTGRWVYRLGRRRAADFIALLRMLTEAFPRAPQIVVICDNDSIHHARAVTRYLEHHARLELLYGARYSPHDNPVERIWAGLKNYVANTAVTWPGRLRQIHSFFRNRSPSQMLDAAAPWTSPWLPPGYEQNFWNAVAHEWLITEPPQIYELRSGRRVSADMADKVEARADYLRRLDDFIGGGDLHHLVAEELDATLTLLREASYTGGTGRRLLNTVGELCHVAGWVTADAGLYALAERYHLTGLHAAHRHRINPLPLSCYRH